MVTIGTVAVQALCVRGPGHRLTL